MKALHWAASHKDTALIGQWLSHSALPALDHRTVLPIKLHLIAIDRRLYRVAQLEFALAHYAKCSLVYTIKLKALNGSSFFISSV